MRILVGGVSELYQGDLDLGRLAADRLRLERLGSGVIVEDLHYGAVAVAQHLEDLSPDALVLVGAVRRDRPPGTVQRRRFSAPAEEAWRAIADAVTGHVSIDLVLEAASGMGVLPARAIAVEVEPASTEPADQLSAEAEAALEGALDAVRTEVRRLPLLELTEQVRQRLEGGRLGGAPVVRTVRALLAELDMLDRTGRWGRAFALRDRVRLGISAGDTPDDMDHLDWGLWWALIEELDRLEAVEVERAGD